MIVDLGIRAGRVFFFIVNQGQMETEKRSHLKAMRWRKLLKLRQHDTYLVVSLKHGLTQSVPTHALSSQQATLMNNGLRAYNRLILCGWGCVNLIYIRLSMYSIFPLTATGSFGFTCRRFSNKMGVNGPLSSLLMFRRAFQLTDGERENAVMPNKLVHIHTYTIHTCF